MTHSAFLEIPPHTVEVIAIERGSVKVIIELPTQSANRLLSAYQGNDPELAKYFAPLILVDLRRETAGLEGTRPDHGDAARPLHEVEWQLKRGWPVGMGRILRSPVFQGVVAVLALVVAIGTWFWPDIRPLLFPSSHSFAYQVRVQTKDTGEYVQGAEVAIEVGGQAPLDDVTDSSGLARILIPSSHANRPGTLIVEATGYKRRVQHIALTPDALPDVVQLEQELPPPDAVVSVDTLELREGPVVVYRALGSYPNGTPLEVLGKEPEERWLKVRTPDVQTGWMFAQHLRVNIALENLPVLMMPRPPCPCQANTDPDTIVCLIEAESKAADDEDISIIHAIFASNATIRDAARDEEWDNPIVRYEKLFRETDFEGPTRFDILPAGPGVNSVESIAWFTSGSTGRYVTYDGYSGSYDNPPGSDHWTLRRDSAGCWVIIDFTFNASHIPFPP